MQMIQGQTAELVAYSDDYYEFVYEVKKNAYKKYVKQYWGRWDEAVQRDYFDKFISSVGKNAYIIRLGNKEIGFFNDDILDDGSYEIGNICIIPEFQRQGIGTKILMKKMEEHRDRNIRIRCFKNNPVLNLYQRLGFSIAEETDSHIKLIRGIDVGIYLKNPCGTLSIPYWKAESMTIPDSIKVIHARDWNGQYTDFERFFRLKHDLDNLPTIDFDHDTIDMDFQTRELAEMINASYGHENISVSEEDILGRKGHKTFHEELCVYINADGGRMVASGIAEYDEKCREGVLEWIQVLPDYRGHGFGTKIVTVLLHRLKKIGAEFVTVSGNLDNETSPLALYRKCGFTGNDVWYICKQG